VLPSVLTVPSLPTKLYFLLPILLVPKTKMQSILLSLLQLSVILLMSVLGSNSWAWSLSTLLASTWTSPTSRCHPESSGKVCTHSYHSHNDTHHTNPPIPRAQHPTAIVMPPSIPEGVVLRALGRYIPTHITHTTTFTTPTLPSHRRNTQWPP
jgi:hypothetical protein